MDEDVEIQRGTDRLCAAPGRAGGGGDGSRQMGVSEATFYIWKKKYAYVGVSELRQLRALEDENARLKRLVADLSTNTC